jgi:hypothetical protein
MWTRPFEVGVSEVVPAPFDRVWSLLSSPGAWSARPGWFSLDTPVTSDAGRPLRFCLRARAAGVNVMALEVDRQDGDYLIRLRALDGQVSLGLSVEPARRGSRIRLSVTAIIERSLKAQFQSQQRDLLRSWGRNLGAICAGQRPWPDGSLPEDVRQACLMERPARDGVEARAQARIKRPADAFWRTCTTPQVVNAVFPGLLHFGLLPGSPASGAGRMIYRLSRRDDRIRVTGSVTTEQQEDVMAVRQLGSPYSHSRYLVRPRRAGVHASAAALVLCQAERPERDRAPGDA